MHTQIDTLIYPRRVLRDGEPCSHKGCLSHLSHPCEGCGRIGGVRAMIFTSAKQSRIDKVFALLLVIVLIGFLQDKLLVWIDKMLFPHKYEGDGSK